jgi:hypothetical protein
MTRAAARRRHEHPRRKGLAECIAYSVAGAGIAAMIVALIGMAPWIAALVATAILVIGFLAWERLGATGSSRGFDRHGRSRL